ncbi:MAG: hypothetical protein AAF483_30535 [Planctomycetota bacterium]
MPTVDAVKASFCIVLQCLLLSSVILPVARCDEHPDKAVAALLNTVVAERAKFQRYIVCCTIKASDFPEYPQGQEITYQVSEPDSHRVIVFDYSGCEINAAKPNFWLGRSGGFYVSGKAGEVSRISGWPKNFNPYKGIPHFDVMGIGFGFFGELKLGTGFDQIVENYSKYPDLKVSGDGDLALLYSASRRPSLIIDKNRGHWPSKTTLAHALWKIQLEKRGDVHVPISFEFTRLDTNNKAQGKFSVELNWRSINEPFALGKEAAATLADEFGGKFEG